MSLAESAANFFDRLRKGDALIAAEAKIKAACLTTGADPVMLKASIAAMPYNGNDFKAAALSAFPNITPAQLQAIMAAMAMILPLVLPLFGG